MKHYNRWRAHGDPLATKITREPSMDARLRYHGWAVTDEGCWEWLGRRTVDGYGRLSYGGREVTATRAAYETWVGAMPEGHYLIRHTCDNPPCINPEHLLTGTDRDNTADKYSRGRARTKLTAQDIPVIRRLLAGGATQDSVAAQFGVSQTAISNVLTGKRWARII